MAAEHLEHLTYLHIVPCSTLLTFALHLALHLTPPYLPWHCTQMVTSQGRRETGGGNASGLCRQVFRAASYSAASESSSPSHTASAPYVFQIRLFSSGATRRARQRTDPRNWISVPCDTTSSGAGNRCFIVEINRLLLGKNPSPVFVNLIFGREQCGEKQGRANGPPHSLPLPPEEEPPTGKPISQSARKQALAGNPSNPRSCSDTFHHFRKHSGAQLQSFLSPSLSPPKTISPPRGTSTPAIGLHAVVAL